MQIKVNIRTQILTVVAVITIIMLSGFDSLSQPAVSIGEHMLCSNTEVLIPIYIEDFEDVAALTLFIEVDTASIDYVGIEDINAIFAEGDFVGGINYTDQFISLNWFSMTAANIDSGLMCNMRLLLKNGGTDFDFLDNCELVHSDLSLIEGVVYTSGSVKTLSSFEINPVSQEILEGNSATISILNLDEGINLQWQIMEEDNWLNLTEESPYSGVNSAQLFIETVSLELNETAFRCMLANEFCNEPSGESSMLVTPNAIVDAMGIGNLLSAYPNPVKQNLTLLINKECQNAGIKVISSNGNLVLHQQIGDIDKDYKVTLNTAYLKSAIYLLQLYENDEIVSTLRFIKQ